MSAMCNDNLLYVLKSGGDLNTVRTNSIDNLSSVNENANSPTYYRSSSNNLQMGEILTINGVQYVPKDSIKSLTETDGMRYCIIRTYSAGVHAGYVKKHSGKEVTLVNARRIWRWAGAFTLSEMAVNGVTKPDECKFSVTVPEITLTEAIEIIPCTDKAFISLTGVKNYEC